LCRRDALEFLTALSTQHARPERTMKSFRRISRRNKLCAAVAVCLSLMAAPAVMAQDVTGSVVGRTASGATVTISNPATGFTRKVTAANDGSYRIPFLPVGEYQLTSSSGGSPVEVRVTLGNATTVNIGSAGAATLGAIQVTGNRVISAVDVTSTESATNLSRQEIKRLPVDQNVTAVTMLAPGVTKGNAGFGGISFGGSSVAENAWYINGLNVTDFYNRNGFSEAPFLFYQEFQVKTGGYSVEYGRTTGGVVNAVVRSGSNQFHAGAQYTFEPRDLQASKRDLYDADGRYLTSSRDNYSLNKLDLYASGPIIKDKLFFFAMYELRDYRPQNTNNAGTVLTTNKNGTGFWGGTIDWRITDNNTLSLMAFSDKNHEIGNVYDYDFDADSKGQQTNTVYNDTGGKSGNLTWTSFLTDNFTMKLMWGRNQREAFSHSLRDDECNYVSADSDVPQPDLPLGCTTNSTVISRDDVRHQGRADFEWTLGNHLLKFGYDHEKNVSNYSRYYTGPGAYYYNVYATTPGATISNGGVVPPGYFAYIRQRQYEISGTFATIDSAYYIQDDWQVTPNLLLSLGLRNDSFDNQDAAGRSYIKIDNQPAPRFGFSWDMKGDGTTKLFGNLGRYYLPVANVINIKQAGGLLDSRTYFAFDGWETQELNGSQYAVPILGPQIGQVDDSQGDGTVGDLRAEVDKNMDPVYQDELILGFEQALDQTWAWGVKGTYRRLHNAIDDMEISATAACGGDGYIGWVMANPGQPVTVWGDTDCDGTADGYVTVDTSKEGWAMYDNEGNYLGQTGWSKPKRKYYALEFDVDRAWDGKWSMNASYTISWTRGNAEGPVNSLTDFDDTGRTENFDNPWVNYAGYGPLSNARRHQFKFRGAYAINDHWRLGAVADIHSGAPISGLGSGNPFDDTNYYSYFICVDKCGNIPGQFDADGDPVPYPSEDRVYVHSPRGGYGHTPWIFDLNASVSYLTKIKDANLQVKFAVYNLLNQQRTTVVDEQLQGDISDETSPTWGQTIGFSSPRFFQLTVSVDF
jgi:hypothetical protein